MNEFEKDVRPSASKVTQFARWLSSEVKADVYNGPTHDGHRNYFETYCEGDMGPDCHDDPIKLAASQFPPGTRIRVELPCCPNCGEVRQNVREFQVAKNSNVIIGFEDMCRCGFDWRGWTEDEYS